MSVQNSTSLATKYRPQEFSDVVEQTVIKSILQNQIKNNKIKNCYLFCGSAGTGKAQPLDSLVLTPDGYVKMRDVKKGTVVYTRKGNETTVFDVYPQGEREVYRITFNDNTSILVADNHLNVVYRYDDKGRREDFVVDTDKLIEIFTNTNRLCVDVPIIDFRHKDVDDKPYNIGWSMCFECNTIPKEYLINDIQTRLSVLHGIFNECGTILENGDAVWKTTIKENSDAFSFLVRSLGCIDIVTESSKMNYNAEFVDEDCIPESCKLYTHTVKNMVRVINENNEMSVTAERYITDISYIGKQECQCIYVEDEDHTYITDNFTPTHNTTNARLFAKEINKGAGMITELDAASHNGVDDIRKLIEDSKFKPIGCDYRVFILDECVTGDTEILTSTGWKRIDSISRNSRVAQYTDDGYIEFVPIKEYITLDYEGDMYEVDFGNECKVLMSPNHVQPLLDVNTDQLTENYVKDIEFSQSNKLIVSGIGSEIAYNLNNSDKLCIACIESGHYMYDDWWGVTVNTNAQFSRLIYLLKESDISYTICSKHDKTEVVFKAYFPDDMKYSGYFDYKFSGSTAREFISELSIWNCGHNGYFTLNKDNADFVSIVLVQSGYSSIVNAYESENEDGKKIMKYFVSWEFSDKMSCSNITKTKVCNFKDKIYCVKVPSKKIILRASGFTFISGNCHSLSNSAWQSMLKAIEEPTPTSVFIFCLDENGLVCTKDGMKKIKDVTSGEYVFTGDGFHVVSNVFNNGQRECLKITLSNGITIKCTPNHRIKIYSDNGDEVWKYASELSLSDCVYYYTLGWDYIPNDDEPPYKTLSSVESIEHCGICNVYDLEVPDVHEFIYNGVKVHNCTTDPQKIPKTILSRVQRYDFQKISHAGIVERLKYIIDNENKCGNHYTYEKEALDYIGKLSDGGMRDAITLTEKALGYSDDLTIESVSKALGTADYNIMFDLTDALVNMDKKAVIELIENINRNSVDLKQFIKQYNNFVLDLCIYGTCNSFDYLQMPSTYSKRIKEYHKDDYKFFTQLLNEVINLNSSIKWETMPKPIIESTFILLCSEV